MSVTTMDPSWFEARSQERLDGDRPVSDLMTTSAEAAALEVFVPCVPSVSAFATVREAAHLMASRGLAQVRVRNARGEIVGVLSTSDLFRWAARSAFDADGDADAGHA